MGQLLPGSGSFTLWLGNKTNWLWSWRISVGATAFLVALIAFIEHLIVLDIYRLLNLVSSVLIEIFEILRLIEVTHQLHMVIWILVIMRILLLVTIWIVLIQSIRRPRRLLCIIARNKIHQKFRGRFQSLQKLLLKWNVIGAIGEGLDVICVFSIVFVLGNVYIGWSPWAGALIKGALLCIMSSSLDLLLLRNDSRRGHIRTTTRNRIHLHERLPLPDHLQRQTDQSVTAILVFISCLSLHWLNAVSL